MTDDIRHRPTPAFRARLEREIVRAYRRETRPVVTHGRWRSRLRAASVVVVCLAIGTLGGLASAQVRDGARRDSLLEAARAELALVAVRLQLAQAQLEDVSRKVRVGAVGASELASAEDELRTMEVRAARARKNIEEIQASAQPSRDELNAPTVGGRDFVTERIQLDLYTAQRRLAAAERELGEVEKRVRVGAVNELALGEARTEVARSVAAMAVLAERLALRKEFLAKGTAPEQLARRLEMTQLREDLHVGLRQLDLARLRATTLERQRAAGAVDELEVLRAQVRIKELERELQLLDARRRLLGTARPDSAR
jgi:hypothetical protein